MPASPRRLVFPHLYSRLILSAIAALGVWGGTTQAQPRVPAFDRFHGTTVLMPSPDDDDDEPFKPQPIDELPLGRVLLGELNCIACHNADGPWAGALTPKAAPVLTGLGERFQPAWVEAFLQNPQQAKPGATMPDRLASLPQAERAEAAKALTAYLVSTGKLRESYPNKPLAKEGAEIFNRIGCTACHDVQKGDGDKSLPSSISLDHVAAKYTAFSLRGFLKDPRHTRPAGRMPSFNLTDEELDRLVAWFLRTVDVPVNTKYQLYHGTWTMLPDFSTLKPVASGDTVGFDINVSDRKDNFALRFEATLPIEKEGEYRFWIGSDDGSRVLVDGKEVAKSDGTHPTSWNDGKIRLKPGDHAIVVEYFEYNGEENLALEYAGPGFSRRDITSSLRTRGGRANDPKPSENTSYQLYHGSWRNLPDFSTLKAVASGTATGFDIGLADRENGFAMRFEATFPVEQDGDYQFWIGSDDGSRLLVDGKEIAKSDGVHPTTWSDGKIALSRGDHAIVVEYVEFEGQQDLALEFAGPGITRCDITPWLRGLDGKLPEDSHKIRSALVGKGKTLFASLNCQACHTFGDLSPANAPAMKPAPHPMSQLAATGGCLSEQPTGGATDYHLSSALRDSLSKVITAGIPESGLAAGEVIHHTLLTLNCYACHQRNRLGGPEQARNEFFQTSMKEMGDEGRIPPALNGVGDKLRDEWLAHVLDRGANDRKNYMLTRMPAFGAPVVGKLAAQLIAADRHPETPPAPFTEPLYKVKTAGRLMVGGAALSCIKCHDFAEHPSTGIRAINMATMTTRLREDWFLRYLANPQEFKPGTRMPAAWPFGTTTLPQVLDGSAPTQIHAVWAYLEDGSKAAIPAGLLREPIELKPTDKPLVYRNFITDAGPRGIGIGFPGGVNLAWDANDMRLALIWHGAFIDASKHWTGRGVGFEGPLGDEILKFNAGPPVAKLSTTTEPWPKTSARESGFRFRGYDLDEHGDPTFHYTWTEGWTLSDRYTPLAQATAANPGKKVLPGLKRTVGMTASSTAGGSPAWFMVLAAKKIEPQEAGVYRVDETWTLRITPETSPTVRRVENRDELLLPMPKESAHAVNYTVEYRW